jgi:hypothetical protein
MPSLFDNSNYNFQLPVVHPTTPSSIGAVNPNIGMNAGYIQPTPYYQTTSPVQAQYNWSAQPRNTPTQAPAPAGQTGWGAQRAQPATFDVDKFIKQMLSPEQQQMDKVLPTKVYN